MYTRPIPSVARLLSGLSLAAAAALVAHPAWAGPVIITLQTSFLDMTDAGYDDSSETDNGGHLTFYVRNDGSTPDGVSSVTINGTPVTSLSGYKWWRAWPPQIPPTGTGTGKHIGTVWVKTMGAPLAEGQNITIGVTMTSGATATQSFTCVTPKCRLANVIPSKDYQQLYIYVANRDTVTYSINQVNAYTFSYYAGQAPELVSLSGSWNVAAGNVAILRLNYPVAVNERIPIRVRVTNTSTNTAGWTGGMVTMVEPRFILGTWSGAMAGDEAGMRYAKKLQLDTVMGPGDAGQIRSMYNRYSIKAQLQKNNDPAGIQAWVNDPALRTWYVRDEPDLNGVPEADVLENNRNYWVYDELSHPTFLNLAQSEKFNRYGMIPDIIGMDHYAAYSAPNCIPGTWVYRKAYLDEAYNYTECLKRNTEPLRMWSWVQMCADGTWDTQPKTWAQNYQWWGHVMTGAKGLVWFKYGPGYETDPDVQANVAEGMQMTRELSQVRNLCLYGEPLDIDYRSTTKVKGRKLVGIDAVVAIIVNNNYSIGGLPFAPTYSVSSQSYNIQVGVPAWIPIQQVYQVTQNGKASVSWSVSGSTVTITPAAIKEDSHIFVIGRNDTAAPDPPTRLAVATVTDASNFVLAWDDAWDNFGIRGYRVYRNGVQVADVRWPLYEAVGVTPGGSYTVRAYDSAGNLSGDSAAVPAP